MLRLAGSVWSAESASTDAQAGVRKIRAMGIDGDEPIIGFAPRITGRDAAFAPLQDAIERTRGRDAEAWSQPLSVSPT
ncbi:hypothetical protein [Microbacterium sp. NPDC057650]|uniref:hypothetical protein n=1 Tax=unclassified Microbacterium TaxID=2609290 RepID=UPI003670DC6E